jgi:hypothetical protein
MKMKVPDWPEKPVVDFQSQAGLIFASAFFDSLSIR